MINLTDERGPFQDIHTTSIDFLFSLPPFLSIDGECPKKPQWREKEARGQTTEEELRLLMETRDEGGEGKWWANAAMSVVKREKQKDIAFLL